MDRKRDEGFSLVEALIALAILAGVAATALMIAGSNIERSDRTTARLRATFAAEALLHRVGLDIALKEQSLVGRLPDGAMWSIKIFPYAEPELAQSRRSSLLQVEVKVAPKRFPAEAVDLKTLRIVGVLL